MASGDLSHIYETESYIWDGKSRPQISNYIAPWNIVASMTPSKWATSSGNAKNSAITYAKNMMQNAIEQYNSDLDFWNEQDARRYNTPASQSERFEDAGYNMGYMYGSVSSGNTNSGYSSPNASSEVASNEAPESLVSEVFLPMIDLFGKFAHQGVDIWKSVKEIGRIDAQTDLYTYQGMESLHRGRKASAESTLVEAQGAWYDFLRYHKPDGSPIGYSGDNPNFEESLAFLSESLGYDIDSAQYKDLQSWLNYCDKAYNNQTTDPMKDVYRDIDSSDMPDAVKSVMKVLTYWASSGGVKTNIRSSTNK